MATINLGSDGQSLTLDDAIARDDKLLKRALTPYYPELANAAFERNESTGELVVKVIKQPGTKGAPSAVLNTLLSAPETINPAVVCYHRLAEMESRGELGTRALLLLQGEISSSVEAGEAQIKEVGQALKSLCSAEPIAATFTPLGF